MGGAYDKNGRKIKVGDVLKVYHFQGAQWRKHYFMFKQVVAEKALGPSGALYLLVSHLGLKDPETPGNGYYLPQNDQTESDVEIVQGLDWYHDRPRKEFAA